MEPKKLVLLLQEVQDILVSYKSETDIVKRSELIFDGVMKAYVVFMTLEDLKQGREVHNMIKELITEFLISWSTSKELSDYQKLLMYSMISYSSSIKIGEEYLHQFVEGFLVLSEREKIVTLLSSFSLLAMDLSLKNKKLSDIDWIDASLLYNILDYYADYAQKNTILLQNSIPDIYLLDINVRTEYILFYSSASEDVLMERIGLPDIEDQIYKACLSFEYKQLDREIVEDFILKPQFWDDMYQNIIKTDDQLILFNQLIYAVAVYHQRHLSSTPDMDTDLFRSIEKILLQEKSWFYLFRLWTNSISQDKKLCSIAYFSFWDEGFSQAYSEVYFLASNDYLDAEYRFFRLFLKKNEEDPQMFIRYIQGKEDIFKNLTRKSEIDDETYEYYAGDFKLYIRQIVIEEDKKVFSTLYTNIYNVFPLELEQFLMDYANILVKE